MFDKIVLGALLGNQEYTRKVLPFLKEEYFSDTADRIVFEQIKQYTNKYNVLPTKEAIIISVNDSNLEEGLFNAVLESVQEVDYNEMNSLEWLVEKSEEWCKERALYNSLITAISISDGSNKDMSKAAIPGILQNALATSFDSSVGHDYFEAAEEQYEYYHSDESRFPFKVEVLNRVTRGGVKSKTLNLIAAGINVGKSTCLLDLAASYLEDGLDCLIVSGEMTEPVVRSRMDVRLMGMKSAEIESLDKVNYLSKVSEIQSKTRGRLVVKDFPSGNFHVGHIRHVLNELKLKKNFVPKVILIDYLGVMASSKLPASAKANSNTYYSEIAVEVRALAHEFDVPIWTAHQVTRGAQQSDDINIDDIAGAIGIMATVDFAVALMVPEQLIAQETAIGKILKNRYANKNAIMKFVIGLSNDYQKLFDVNESAQDQIYSKEEKQEKPKAETGGWKFD